MSSIQVVGTGAVTCGPGQFVDGRSCSTCIAGRYQSSSSHAETSCSICSPGHFTSSSSSDTDLSWGRTNGATHCNKCPAGYYTLQGDSSCTSCPAGKYQAITGSTSCLSCSSGQTSTHSAETCYSPSSGGDGDAGGGGFPITIVVGFIVVLALGGFAVSQKRKTAKSGGEGSDASDASMYEASSSGGQEVASDMGSAL